MELVCSPMSAKRSGNYLFTRKVLLRKDDALWSCELTREARWMNCVCVWNNFTSFIVHHSQFKLQTKQMLQESSQERTEQTIETVILRKLTSSFSREGKPSHSQCHNTSRRSQSLLHRSWSFHAGMKLLCTSLHAFRLDIAVMRFETKALLHKTSQRAWKQSEIAQAKKRWSRAHNLMTHHF